MDQIFGHLIYLKTTHDFTASLERNELAEFNDATPYMCLNKLQFSLTKTVKVLLRTLWVPVTGTALSRGLQILQA